jgi:hypothetical protein
MALRYDPKHARRWVPSAGSYAFRVLSCHEATFRTGSEGIWLQLQIDAGGPAPLRISDAVVFGERSTWKMLELCEALGVRFDPPCEADELIAKEGRARFGIDEVDGLITLKVVRYLPRAGSGAARGGRHERSPG